VKLGFHYHAPAIEKTDGIYMSGFLGCFIDSLASHCEHVECFLHSPLTDETKMMDYRIAAQNVSLTDIGPHTSVINRTLKSRTYTSALRRNGSRLDALLVRGASPLLPAMVSASPVPTIILLVSDYLAGVNDLPQPRWRKEAIRLWSYWNKWGQDRSVRRSLTFVNSRVLFDEYKEEASKLYETRTSTLSEHDFFIRPDTCQSGPIHLLYTGRISVSKGLFDIVEAMRQLLARGQDLILDIVGWPEKGEEEILDNLFLYAKKNGFRDRVLYHGYRTVGPELFSYYKKADIFVLASRSSFEGFPRTIWEAMAHSLPVVATRVSSIPAFIEGSAELVQPCNPDELANAIDSIICDPTLRSRFIRRGLELARENTLEIQVGKMVATIQSWLETQHE
jgi:glycosyltransferase involved in cell wall biosynthesis